ncbi:MAG: acyl carrier protein [Nitrosarchaeum sp.]|nr:acyl carrier protein [Nitrosarchaeum sp.]
MEKTFRVIDEHDNIVGSLSIDLDYTKKKLKAAIKKQNVKPLLRITKPFDESVVVSIISIKLGVNLEKVVPSADLVKDLGTDSLDFVELVMAFEDHFGIELDDDDMLKLKTVEDMVNYLKDKV